MRKLKIFISVIGIALGAALFGTNVAHAGTGNQWCDSLGYCPNAWNGGPFVKTYGYSTVNNDFTLTIDENECNGGYTTTTCPSGMGSLIAGLPIVMFVDTDGGAWNGNCIGDAYNDPNRADTSLNQCGGGSNGTGGWGVNYIQAYQPTYGCDTFANIHWSQKAGAPRGLNWSGDGNGITVYLNNVTSRCLVAQPPA